MLKGTLFAFARLPAVDLSGVSTSFTYCKLCYHLKQLKCCASRKMNNVPSNFSQAKAHKMHDEPPKLSLYSTNVPKGAAPL